MLKSLWTLFNNAYKIVRHKKCITLWFEYPQEPTIFGLVHPAFVNVDEQVVVHHYIDIPYESIVDAVCVHYIDINSHKKIIRND